MIGTGHLEPLAREPVVGMHPHTAPQSHVKVRVVREINQDSISITISAFYT